LKDGDGHKIAPLNLVMWKNEPCAGSERDAYAACVLSCRERKTLRAATLRNLAATDWGAAPVLIQIDPGEGPDTQRRQTFNSLLALKLCLNSRARYFLFLEDDLLFNRHLFHNLVHWRPLRERTLAFAGLYNPGLARIACDLDGNFVHIAPTAIFGSQAFLISRYAADYFINHWAEVEGMQDIRMSRLAGRLESPIHYHSPSLVQHVGRNSLWGGPFHQAVDFNPDWRA
jgi:hypothetical protein